MYLLLVCRGYARGFAGAGGLHDIAQNHLVCWRRFLAPLLLQGEHKKHILSNTQLNWAFSGGCVLQSKKLCSCRDLVAARGEGGQGGGGGWGRAGSNGEGVGRWGGEAGLCPCGSPN